MRYLQQSRALGDALCIAMNADDSVRVLKGPDRPINGQLDRAEVLLALACVDVVVIFEEPRTTDLIRTIRPHVFAKGGDYTPETLNPEERGALHEVGAEIAILPEVKGQSTTATLAKLVDSYLSPAHRDGLAQSCAVTTLAGDVARSNDRARSAYTRQVGMYLELMTKLIAGEKEKLKRTKAITALSTLVGAVSMARAVNDLTHRSI